MNSPAVIRQEIDEPNEKALVAAKPNSVLLVVEKDRLDCFRGSVGHEPKHEAVNDMGLDKSILRGDARAGD